MDNQSIKSKPEDRDARVNSRGEDKDGKSEEGTDTEDYMMVSPAKGQGNNK